MKLYVLVQCTYLIGWMDATGLHTSSVDMSASLGSAGLAGSARSLRLDAPTMTQLRPDDVRRVAEAAGLHEIYFNQTSCVISFAPDEDDFTALSRINVYYSTGTVATSLEDPRQGKTLLFRRDVDIPLLRELMLEPRLRTSKGDHQRNVRPRREPCVVCLDKQPHITLVCGHTALCNGCADQLPRASDGLVACPLCRARSGLSIVKGTPGSEEAEALAQVAVLRAQAATAEIAEQIEAAEGVIVACRKRREDDGRREAEQQRERRADELAELAGYRATLGDTHPDTLTSINDLGEVLLDQGDLAAAEPLLREALAGYREIPTWNRWTLLKAQMDSRNGYGLIELTR